MTIEIDAKLAGALALAVAQQPRANLQQIAKSAGISKATLYRISATRDGVIELLMTMADRHMRSSISDSDLDNGQFISALSRLTENLIQQRELYLFWNASLWINLGDTKDQDIKGYSRSFFSDAIERFFLSGQKAGVFRIDMPARWIAKSYDFLLYAAIESAQRGEIASLGIAELVNKTFLSGSKDTETF